MLKLSFDYRDVFRGPRLALSMQRMWIVLVGGGIGFVLYLILTYAGLLAAGIPAAKAWDGYGLMACIFSIGESVPWYSIVLGSLGSFVLIVSLLIAQTACARAVYMSSKGNTFYTWREAYRFALQKSGSVILTPVALAVLIGLMVLGFLVIGLLGKIPFIGEIGVSLFTPLWFLGALLILFFGIVAVVAFILVPSIIATNDEDAFEAVFQSFSVLWTQPWRLIAYELLNGILTIFAVGIFAWFFKQAILIMNTLFIGFMGGDFVNLSNNGLAMLQSWTALAVPVIESIYRIASPFVYFSEQFITIPAAELPISVVISSYIYALAVLFLVGWILAYGVATFVSSNTMLFIAIKMRKDEENLLERRDREEELPEDTDDEEEFVPEETGENKENE